MSNDFENKNNLPDKDENYENLANNYEAEELENDSENSADTAWLIPEEKVKKESAFIRFLKYLFPWKGDSTKEIIRKIIFFVALIVLIVCGVILGGRFIERQKSDGTYNELNQWKTEMENMENTEENWDKIKAQYPDVDFPEGMNIKWARLYAANQDFVGWINIPGTNISYPIVQGKDNAEYLYLDFNRQDTNYGNPFMDYRNDIQDLDKNTIIYGHHMRDNMIFAPLKEYKSTSTFQKSPIIELSTLYDDYTFKIYGVFFTNAYPEQNNGYVFNFMHTSFGSNDNFMEYIEQVDMRKLYTTGVDIKPTDKIITLNTCAYEFTEARLVVIGRLVREGEDTSVDTSKVQLNSNPLWPQAYYDKKGIENPFKDYENWYLD